ncbi:MAG: pectate lyase, partial [Candidatus Latescibacteria bacterium]|nr:pectate lyase [Candidatus Latescibacterota bacterium]
MKRLGGLLICVGILSMWVCEARADEALKEDARKTMVKATQFFRSQVATEGGYLWVYKPDFSVRE